MNIYELKKLHDQGSEESWRIHYKKLETYRAHCVDNFVQALEALKAEHEVAVNASTAGWAYHKPNGCPVCKLIRELETVK